MLLSSLLRQLLTPERLIFASVRNECLELCNKYSKNHTIVSEHVRLIQVLSRMSQRTFLFVDAIDKIAESGVRGEDIRNNFLKELFRLSSTCRVFVTSRPHIDTDCFKTVSHQETIEILATNEDISTYVKARISASQTLKEFVEKDPTLESIIINSVQEKANGV